LADRGDLTRKTEITKNAFIKGFAQEIYKVTGSNNIANTGCGNFPAPVLSAAKDMGVKNIQLHFVKGEARNELCDAIGNTVDNSLLTRILNFILFKRLDDFIEMICEDKIFDMEVEFCKRVVGDDNVIRVASFEDYEEPKEREVQQLLVVIKGSKYDNNMPHWIAKDARGLYFDPIKGESGLKLDGLASKNPQPVTVEANIVRKNSVDCTVPNEKETLTYHWIGLWITYSM
jgi:hypothetical protein